MQEDYQMKLCRIVKRRLISLPNHYVIVLLILLDSYGIPRNLLHLLVQFMEPAFLIELLYLDVLDFGDVL